MSSSLLACAAATVADGDGDGGIAGDSGSPAGSSSGCSSLACDDDDGPADGTSTTSPASSSGGDEGCHPPDSVPGEGGCVPSCGGAGGNTCVGAGSTVCAGLPALVSYDCEICCARPDYPAPTPASFHFIDASAPTYWDAIATLAVDYPSIVFVAHNKPDAVDVAHWCAHRSYKSDPPTAADLNALLVDPVNGPRYVMIDELHDAESEAYLVALADEMRTTYPQWAGRWGAFVGFGDYPVWSAGIDALLAADAILSLELYPRQSEYCAAGSNGGQRDIWLAEQFAGNAQIGRVNWLVARKANLGSSSFITPLFGVGDVLLDGNDPAFFLDRMFYAWVTRTDHADMLAIANGGPGAYKWTPPTELGYGVSNTSRDLAFSESVAHYSIAKMTSSRLGPVPCP